MQHRVDALRASARSNTNQQQPPSAESAAGPLQHPAWESPAHVRAFTEWDGVGGNFDRFCREQDVSTGSAAAALTHPSQETASHDEARTTTSRDGAGHFAVRAGDNESSSSKAVAPAYAASKAVAPANAFDATCSCDDALADLLYTDDDDDDVPPDRDPDSDDPVPIPTASYIPTASFAGSFPASPPPKLYPTPTLTPCTYPSQTVPHAERDYALDYDACMRAVRDFNGMATLVLGNRRRAGSIDESPVVTERSDVIPVMLELREMLNRLYVRLQQ